MAAFLGFFARLFSSDFMPHGGCFLWQPSLLWLHAGSDGLIALAYFSIPLTLLYFLRRRPGLRLNGLILMFGGFILACGVTHLMSIWNLWHSSYRLEGVLKAVTALLSLATAVAAVKLAPVAVHLPTPEEAERTHQSLRDEIKARKAAEEQLRVMMASERVAGEARLRSYLEAASQGILAVSNEGRILLVNRSLEEMFGYDRSELIGQPLEILLPKRYHRQHAGHRAMYFVDPRVRPMGVGLDLAGRRKDGTEFPVEIGLNSVETDEGKMALGLVSDITDRKHAADEVARANKELRRSNTELGDFAHIASHDLQEPLRMITSYLQLLDRRYGEQLDSEAREFIGYAVDGAARMKSLIQDLLSFSRAGTAEASFRPVSAGILLDHALANLEVAIDESHARVTSDILPEIFADAGLFAQVFQNLIGNAIKFRGSEPPSIHISATEQGASWVFSVRDNGIGIDPQHATRVFRIFERLHNADQYPGTGVGLAITQKIVERHGGTIWFESQIGNGTTFYFSIPIRQALAMSQTG